MELATAGLFRARWTNQIHDEWIRNVLKNRPDLTGDQLERTRSNMNRAVMGCLVEGYQFLIDAVTLPDAGDRHVLAAAIHGSADAIITANLKHFPKAELAKYDIEAQHPDEFLHHQFGLDPACMITAAQRVRKRLKNPPKTAEEYLETLEAQQLPQTVSELRPYVAVI
jgi:PIN domain